MQPIRQGDVILSPLQHTNTASGQEMGQKLPHLILAEGEVTGHRHQISNGQAELHSSNGILYLHVVSESATLVHEEHKSIQIPQGSWIVRIQRQYEPEGWDYVAD